MNRNTKPSNKEQMFYFINASLLPKLPSEVPVTQLALVTTPDIVD